MRRRTNVGSIRQLARRYDSAHDNDERQKLVCDLYRHDPAELISLCRADAGSKLWRRRHRAAWILAEMGHPKKPFVKERIDMLQRFLDSDRSTNVRSRAAHSLGVIGTESALRVLSQAWNNPSPLVRMFVAAYIGQSRKYLRLLLRLARDSNPYVREWVAFSLGTRRLASPGTIRVLRRLLKDRAPSVQREAVRALITHRDESAVGLLIKLLDNYGVDHELVSAVQELALWAKWRWPV